MILLHGASGFVAKHLIFDFEKFGRNFCIQTRNVNKIKKNNIKVLDSNIKKLSQKDTLFIKKNIETLVYVSGIAHTNQINFFKKIILKKKYNEDIKNFKNYLKIYQGSNLKRIIFLSSSKINEIYNNQLINEDNEITNKSNYSKYKLRLENIIIKFCENSNINYTIIRPPMIYGVGFKGNLNTLIKIIKIGFPLSLIDFKSSRSYLFIGNLLSFIATIIDKRIDQSSIVFISNNDDMHLNDIIKFFTMKFNKKLYSNKYSKFLKPILSFILPKSINNLIFSSFLLNKMRVKKYYNWTPKITSLEGLKLTFNDDKKNI